MSLKALYQQFLTAPNPTSLAEGASLNYITTLTTVNEPSFILKHLAKEEKQVKKKEEKVLDAIEAQDAVFLEIETTMEFLTSGGAYLPGLDDNFLADRTVTFPITHVVHFDPNRKIKSIRLSWDQGSLLKLVDVIGSRARAWPIRDGKDQARLIASSVASVANASGSAARGARQTGVTRESDEAVNTSRGHSSSMGSKNVTRDPHASLSLFGSREENDDASYPTAIAPRGSAKPAPRDYHDLFVRNDENSEASTGFKHPAQTPVAHKAGAGKNYQPSRLFETEDPNPGTPVTPHESPNKGVYKPHPTKYNHFDFGDGSDEPPRQPDASPSRPVNTKHQSQWDFKDFNTPEQRRIKVRGQDVRQFGLGDEEGEHAESPVKPPKQAQARPDNKTQIELQDDEIPAGDRRSKPPRGAAQNKGMGLYQMNLYNDDELVSSANKGGQQNKPLSNVTNTNNHRKDFSSQFTLADQSPSSNPNVNNENKPLGENKQKAVKVMDSNWDTYDQSPRQPQVKKENVDRKSANTGIKTGGDGMGGKKGATRSWGFGDDSDGEGPGGVNRQKFQASKKQQAPAEDSFWDY